MRQTSSMSTFVLSLEITFWCHLLCCQFLEEALQFWAKPLQASSVRPDYIHTTTHRPLLYISTHTGKPLYQLDTQCSVGVASALVTNASLPGKWQKRCLPNTTCSFLGLPSQATPVCFPPSVYSVGKVGPRIWVQVYTHNSWYTCKFFPNFFHHGSLSLLYLLGVAVHAHVLNCFSSVWLCNSFPWTVATRLLHPWGFPGKSSWVGYYLFLQGIFPIHGSNPYLLHFLHYRRFFTTDPPEKPLE